MDISNVADDIKTIEQGNGAPADVFVEQEHTAEEEAANRAAAELQERKKRRKKRNRILMILAVILIGAGIFGYRKYQAYQEAQAEAEADVLALEDGEELTYGEITQVIGNDITVAVVVEDSSSSEDVNAKAPADHDRTDGDGGANISDTQNAPSGDAPSDALTTTDGNMPSGAGAPSGMPDGNAGSMPSGMPSGTGNGQTAAGGTPGGMPQMNRVTYTETGETREYEIPVGTDVTTMLGSTTTFAKLKTGNVIGIVTQAGTDNILRIKIIQ